MTGSRLCKKNRIDTLKKGLIPALIMILIATFALTGCGEVTNEYAEAEAKVAEELEALKQGGNEMPALADFPEDISEAQYSAYAKKLRDFDYVIAGSEKSKDGNSINVTVDITTYDFGSVYLETWNDQMKIEESLRYESQFYNDLFTRFAAMSVKKYSGSAVIACTKNENGEWTTDIKENAGLLNAISGGMVKEMLELAEEAKEAEQTEEPEPTEEIRETENTEE